MYLCLCYGVTDRKIKELLQDGVCSLQEVQKICNAGTNCGSCICQLKEMLKENEKTAPCTSDGA